MKQTIYKCIASCILVLAVGFQAGTAFAQQITAPTPGSVLSGSSETFTWQDSGGIGVTQWWVYAGSTTGGRQYFDSGDLATATSVSVTGLPSNGSTVHIRLWYRVGSTSWQSIDESYTAATGTMPEITAPVAPATLSGASEVFTWSDVGGLGVTQWWVYAGSTLGKSQYHSSGNLGAATTTTVTGLPVNGTSVYIRLWYRIGGGAWQSIDEVYTAATAGLPDITSPVPSSTLSGATETFNWADSGGLGITEWWIYAGSTTGGRQYFDSGNLFSSTSTAVTGLPTDGTSTVYIRLWYRAGGGAWSSIDETYTAASGGSNPLANATGLLNDTGTRIGGGYPSGNNADCSAGTSLSEQDCSHGRDALNAVGSLTKTGSGSQGFDYTKISSTGAGLSQTASSWDCVLDNQTGFMWEVKTTAGDLHDASDRFTWYDSNPATNGGALGNGADGASNMSCFGYVAGDPSTYCNTEAFVARVNAAGLCGYNNWRVPTYLELLSIIDHSRLSPAIDLDFFPNTPVASGNYNWTASPITANPNQAWNIRSKNGYGSSRNNTVQNSVRLIRTE